MKGDVQALAHSVGVLAVLLGVAHPCLVQRVPVLHEHTCDVVACARIRGSTVSIHLDDWPEFTRQIERIYFETEKHGSRLSVTRHYIVLLVQLVIEV